MFCNPVTTNETLKEELLRELTDMLTTEVIPIVKEDLEMKFTKKIDSLKTDNAALKDSKENKENEMIPDIIDKLVIKFTIQIDDLKADNQLLHQNILDISTVVKTLKESEEDEKDNQTKKKIDSSKKNKENDMIPNIIDGLIIKFTSEIENLKADNQLIHQKILDISAAVKNPVKESKEVEKDSQTKKKTKKKTAVGNDHNTTLRLLRNRKVDKTANNRHHDDVGILPLHRNDDTPLCQSLYNGLKPQTTPNNLRLTVHDRLALTDTFASAARKSNNYRKGRRCDNRNGILSASKACTDNKKYSVKPSTPSAVLNLNRFTSYLRTSSTKTMMRNSVQKHSNLIHGKTKRTNAFLHLPQTEIQS